MARPALQELLADVGDADVGRWTGIITACFLVGAALGGLLFGWLGDRLGRVRAMAASIVVYSVFTGAGFFATEAWHLGLFRFIASLQAIATVPCIDVLAYAANIRSDCNDSATEPR